MRAYESGLLKSKTLVSLRALVVLSVGACSAFATFVQAATTNLADQPVATGQSVPGNVLLDLSVEYPTAVDVANLASSYVNTAVYPGYFDPAKCYTYTYSAITPTVPPTTDGSYFQPASLADSN